ncbi:class I SAM-dependent methyltransferase [Candidatus Bathyarchaeota archaeon]|nr:class I SAM-dependent methyltransferase [Candidatus Bathyarchaeota archaeon]
MRFQVEPHYYYESYDTKERFCSYWHQIDEIVSLNPTSILEIGVGNNFVSNYLKYRRFDIVTLDIDRRLRPDIAGSVLNIPFRDETFEVVACYEVLEHLPYEHFSKAMLEICRVSNSHVLLSLPDTNRVYRVYIQIPKLGEFKELIEIPRLKKPIHHFDGHHYWEIGKAGSSLKRVINDIVKLSVYPERTYRVFEIPYHRIFVLKKLKKIKL